MLLNAAVMCTVHHHYISCERSSLDDWGLLYYQLFSAEQCSSIALLSFASFPSQVRGVRAVLLSLSLFSFLSARSRGRGRGVGGLGRDPPLTPFIFHFGIQGETRGRCMIIYVATRLQGLRHCSFCFSVSSSRPKARRCRRSSSNSSNILDALFTF